MHLQIPEPPWPADSSEKARWKHTRLRRRLLDGSWRQDIEERLKQHLGVLRSDAMGPPDMSANPYRVITREVSTLFTKPPTLRHDLEEQIDLGPLIGERGAIASSGLWAQMRRYQAWVVGCREYLLRLVATADGRLHYRPVAPDMVQAWSTMTQPDRPVTIWELRLRQRASGKFVWAWDVLDISDPQDPVYKVFAATDGGKLGDDLSAEFLDADYSGASYPYRKKDGTPVLPYVMHHAEMIGDRLWDPYEGTEVLEGSLNLAVLMSFWLHYVRDTAWAQKYAVNARPAGLETIDQDALTAGESTPTRQEIVTDPSTLLVFEAIRDEAAVVIGQFQPPGSPKELYESIEAYGAKLAHDAGISSSDMQRMSADPRSGYAISLSNEGKRKSQEDYSAQFRAVDEQLIALSAILLNVATGSDYPEDGYSVVYAPIPLSPEERRSREESVLRRLNARLLKRVDAYRELNPGLSEQQAKMDLDEIEENDDGRGRGRPEPAE